MRKLRSISVCNNSSQKQGKADFPPRKISSDLDLHLRFDLLTANITLRNKLHPVVNQTINKRIAAYYRLSRRPVAFNPSSVATFATIARRSRSLDRRSDNRPSRINRL